MNFPISIAIRLIRAHGPFGWQVDATAPVRLAASKDDVSGLALTLAAAVGGGLAARLAAFKFDR